MLSSQTSRIQYGTDGKRMPGNLFSEVLIASLCLFVFVLLDFLLCLVTRQTILIVANLLTFAVAAAGIVCAITQDTFLLWLLAFLSAADWVLEWGLATSRIIVLLFLCDQHKGCITAFIPYVVLAGLNIILGFVLLLLFIQSLFTVMVKSNWDTLSQAPENVPTVGPVGLTIRQLSNYIFRMNTGEEPPTFEDLRLAKITAAAQTQMSQTMSRFLGRSHVE